MLHKTLAAEKLSSHIVKDNKYLFKVLKVTVQGGYKQENEECNTMKQ